MTEERTVFDDFEYKGRKVDLADTDYSKLSDDVLIERFNTFWMMMELIEQWTYRTVQFDRFLWGSCHDALMSSDGKKMREDVLTQYSDAYLSMNSMVNEMFAEIIERGYRTDYVTYVPADVLCPYCDKEEEE